MDFLLEQDRAAAARIRHSRDWDGRLRYTTDEAALFELAGHPHVFNDDGAAMEVVQREPELVVDEHAGGLRARLVPDDGDSEDYHVRLADGRRCEVIRFTPGHKRLRAIIPEGGLELPAAARARLLDAVSGLASEVRIHGGIAGGAETAREVAADPRPRMRLEPSGAGLAAELVVEPVPGSGTCFEPGTGGRDGVRQPGWRDGAGPARPRGRARRRRTHRRRLPGARRDRHRAAAVGAPRPGRRAGAAGAAPRGGCTLPVAEGRAAQDRRTRRNLEAEPDDQVRGGMVQCLRHARGRRRPDARSQAVVRVARRNPRLPLPGAPRRRVHRADRVVPPSPRRSSQPLLAERARVGPHARHGGARAAGLRRGHDARRGRGVADAAGAVARRGRVRAGPSEHTARRSPPLSARRLSLARAARPVGGGRVSRRRHGSRQDRAVPRAAARPRPGRGLRWSWRRPPWSRTGSTRRVASPRP